MKVSKVLTTQRLTVKKLWDKMCADDNIPVSSPFAVFSQSNPSAAKYNAAMGKLQTMISIHMSFANMPLFFQERYSRAYDAAMKGAF